MTQKNTRQRIRERFLRTEDGGMTALGLMLLLCALTFSGLAMDVAFAYKTRTELQIASDAAAHAALYTRELGSLDDARTAALDLVEKQLPSAVYGTVLTADDIQFGTFDETAEVFTPDNSQRGAVMVNTSRFASKNNAAPAFLLNLVGMESWDIQTGSVFSTYRPSCLREGFVAQGRVDMQSNNDFENGFCIHSATHVEFNNNNTFESGTIVSMPNPNDLVGSFTSNTGLEEALRDASYRLRIVDRIDDIIDGLYNADDQYLPDYINNKTPITLKAKDVDAASLKKFRIHHVTCNGNQKLTLSMATLRSMVILTSCKVSFGGGIVLEDVVIATSNTDASSVTSSANTSVGLDDNCVEGGGAQIVTKGGMNFPAKLNLFGGQLLAKGDIEFAANADGLEGASIVAGGEIDGTSNAKMGFCGSGMEDNFEADYFRLSY